MIAEHGRATALLGALAVATDATLADEHVKVSFNTTGTPSFVELPHMLVRSMFGSGALAKAVKDYRNSIGERLSEGFGILIEDDVEFFPQHKGSNVE